VKLFMTITLLTSVLLLGAVPAEGAIVNYNFPINGAQEVPPVATPASGLGLVTLDTATNQLDWNINFAGLLGSETAAHFHGPATVGLNAGVQIALPVGSPKIGNQILTDPQEADVLAGLWYVNIHSTQFPGGEIRGQVTPEPATLGVLIIMGGFALLKRKRGRSGRS
jgi:hypothetical protein